MLKRVAGMILSAVLTLASGSFAAVPQEVGYQGYLTDAGGVPVNGSANITFSLYTDTEDTSTPLWSENQTVSLDKGLYSVSLGAVTPLNLPFDTRYYLGIRIGTEGELRPRHPLASTPYAHRAKQVEDGAVTDATISGTISGSKLGSHSHSGADITAGAVAIVNGGTGATEASAARTNLSAAKAGVNADITSLTGVTTPISAAQGGTGVTTGLTALNASNLTSGTISEDRLPTNLQKKYGKVAVVAQSGGDYTNPVTAMNAVGTWCGIPSAANPCLLKIMPGVYNTGASSVAMLPYVSIEGSGESVTILSGSVNSEQIPPANGLVIGANNAEISFLTVKNTGSGSLVSGLLNTNASPKMTNITIIVSGANAASYGVFNHSSSPDMNNVTVTATSALQATCYGVVNYINSSPTMSNIKVTASGGNQAYGLYNSGTSSPNMHNVIATASGGTDNNYGVYNTASSSPAMKNVTASGSGGSTSHGVYNGGGSSPAMSNVTATGSGGSISNYGVYNSGSTTMNNVIASATGGTVTYGVYNSGYSPSMINVTVSASGATSSSHGVYNFNSSPIMNTVTISASGAGLCYGLLNYASSPKISNVAVTAKSGTSNYGLFNNASSGIYTLLIDSSSFEGSTSSVYNDTEFTLRIGGSKLTGGAAVALGTYNCVGVYDGDTYTALGANCQ